jgi:hypothetical protein
MTTQIAFAGGEKLDVEDDLEAAKIKLAGSLDWVAITDVHGDKVYVNPGLILYVKQLRAE